jgi:hypothetical protein
MNFHQKIAVVIVDVVVLAELCVSMFMAYNNPENFTPVFFKSFLGMLIPTLILARIAIKRLGTQETPVES